jgi:hypothetical protein
MLCVHLLTCFCVMPWCNLKITFSLPRKPQIIQIVSLLFGMPNCCKIMIFSIYFCLKWLTLFCDCASFIKNFWKLIFIRHYVNSYRQLVMAVQRMGWPKLGHRSYQQTQATTASPRHNCSTTVQSASIPVGAAHNKPHRRLPTLLPVFQT